MTDDRMGVAVRILIIVNCLSMLVVPTLTANPLSMVTNRIPRLKLAVEELDNCHPVETKETPIRLQGFVINRIGFNKYVVSGKVNISKPFEEPTSSTHELYKCGAIDEDASCEYYITIRKTNLCSIMKEREDTWKSLIKHTDLPEHCPVLPKVYTVENSTVSLQDLSRFPFFQSRWKTVNKFYNKQELLACIVFSFSTEIVRNG